MKLCEHSSPADTKVTAEGEGGGASGTGAEGPVPTVVKIMVRQLCPCSAWRTLLGQVDATEGVCEPAGSLHWSRFPGRSVWPHESRAHSGAGLLAGHVTLCGAHCRAACSSCERVPILQLRKSKMSHSPEEGELTLTLRRKKEAAETKSV